MIAGCRNCAHTVTLGVGDRVPRECPNCGIDWRTTTTAPVGRDWYALVPYPANVLPLSDAFTALARYLDAHPGRHAALMRHDGKWVIRAGGAIGFGHTPGEAAELVGHTLDLDRDTRAALDTIPEVK